MVPGAPSEEKETEVTPTKGTASISVAFFVSFTGDYLIGETIYILVQDRDGNALHNGEVVTDEMGYATFENLPECEATVKLWDKRNNRWVLKLDLREFTGENRGKQAGEFDL